jgi:tetratricopeptide (TPR) repeat protein
MKHLYTLIFLLLVSTNIIAQEREILPVNWKQIKEDVNKDPQKVKDLVARLSATSLDTTLTYQDRILAFYGQSFLTNDEEEKLKIKMYDQKDKGHITESLETAKKILEINPLNLEALNHAGQILYAMANDSTANNGITKEDAKQYFNRAMRIFNTIAMTGDGSDEHPFYVTKVSDEYCFMRFYLDLWEYQMQAATSCCDIITLKKNSKYYNQPKIYFEITRVYELERMQFQKKKKSYSR